MAFDKAGGEFSEEDEALLVELATLASLGLKHVQARLEADRRASQYALFSAELDQRVQERTAELEQKNGELQEFAFVASHDLAEPLRPGKGSIFIVDLPAKPQEKRRSSQGRVFTGEQPCP